MNGGFWQHRPVFVTGATGLVGGWLVRRLLELRAQVVCLVRDWVPRSELLSASLIDKVTVVRGALECRDTLERALVEYEIDTVFHLAAQTLVPIANRNGLSTFESNIRGTWNLLEGCRRASTVRAVIIASSDKAYGEQEVLPYTEQAPLHAIHPYDVSKACSDMVARSYAATWNLPVAVTRCGNFYGGGDLNWNRIVPGTIRSILCGQAPLIRSDGNYVRDYFYVEDGAAAYMLLAERLHADPALRGLAFNFSNEIQVTVLDLVEEILRRMDSPLRPDVRNEASSEIRRQYLSAALARRVLGWSPSFELGEGLDRTIRWYKEYFAA